MTYYRSVVGPSSGRGQLGLEQLERDQAVVLQAAREIDGGHPTDAVQQARQP
jgi:hypothetical protein